jgi:hypothetical protein
MKFINSATTILGAISLIGAATIPAAAFVAPEVHVETIEVEVLPTSQEVGSQLQEVGQRLRQAELASAYNPAVDRDFVAAQRDYQEGRYEDAIAQAERPIR